MTYFKPILYVCLQYPNNNFVQSLNFFLSQFFCRLPLLLSKPHSFLFIILLKCRLIMSRLVYDDVYEICRDNDKLITWLLSKELLISWK